jgi:hypothetical protein
MGCDIHVIVEINHNGKWYPEMREQVSINRCYELFTMLAGVRNYEEVSAPEPKGLPEGMHEWTREYMSNVDFHSYSWVSCEEAEKIPETVSASWWYMVRYFKSLSWLGDGIRFVIAFDN